MFLVSKQFPHAAMLLLLCLVLFSPSLAFGQTHEICFSRPDKLGKQYAVQGTASFDFVIVVAADGKEIKKEERHLQGKINATATTQEVDDRGTRRKIKLVVEEFLMSEVEEEELKEGLATGTEVEVSLEGGEFVFRVDGEPVMANVAEVLKFFITSGMTKRNDLMFGTEEEKKVGDSWPIQTENAAKFIGREFDFKPENFSGETTLLRIKPVNEIDCLVLKSECNVDVSDVPIVPGMAADGKASMVSFAARPTDNDNSSFFDDMTFEIDASAKGRPSSADGAGPEMSLTAELQQKVRVEWKAK